METYDLDTLEGIESIAIPEYQQLNGIASPINNIEYVLQRKATDHKRNGRMDLAIACLRKSNEIFPYSNFLWSKKDYLRLVRFLKEAGKFEEARAEQAKIDKLFEKDLAALVFEKVMRDCKSLRTDLVQTGDNSRVCEECAKYTRRIFSISGKDKRFPILPEYLKLNIPGHNYCYFSIYPFFFSLSEPTWRYKGDLIKWSNRPFADKRTPQQKAYYKNYVLEIEQEIIDRDNYNLLLEKSPEIAPKSFGGYRRMKNLHSSNYQKLADAAFKEGINLDASPDISVYHF